MGIKLNQRGKTLKPVEHTSSLQSSSSTMGKRKKNHTWVCRSLYVRYLHSNERYHVSMQSRETIRTWWGKKYFAYQGNRVD